MANTMAIAAMTMGAPQARLANPGMGENMVSIGLPREHYGGLGPREDIEAAFGSPSNGPDTMTWYDSQKRDHYLLPDAYAGENRHMSRLVIVGLARMNAGSVFHRIAPLRFENGLRQITYEVHRYHDTTWVAEPEEGVANFASKSRSSWTTSAFRIAKAFRMEHGFALTAAGKEDYMASMLQITCGLRDRIELSIIAALRNPPLINNPDLREARRRGFALFANTLRERIDLESSVWFIVQKGTDAQFGNLNNIRMMLSIIEDQFRRNGSNTGGPTILLTTPGAKRLIGDNPSEYASWEKMGPIGASIRDSGNMLTREAARFGVEVHEVDLYPLEENTENQCPLVDYRAIGEFYVMSSERLRLQPGERPTVRDMDLVVMDYETDSVKIMRYEDAFRATGLFKTDGTYNPDIADMFFNNCATLRQWADSFNAWGVTGPPRADASQQVANASLTRKRIGAAKAIRGGAKPGDAKPMFDSHVQAVGATRLLQSSRKELVAGMAGHVTPLDSQIITAFSLAASHVPGLFAPQVYYSTAEIPDVYNGTQIIDGWTGFYVTQLSEWCARNYSEAQLNAEEDDGRPELFDDIVTECHNRALPVRNLPVHARNPTPDEQLRIHNAATELLRLQGSHQAKSLLHAMESVGPAWILNNQSLVAALVSDYSNLATQEDGFPLYASRGTPNQWLDIRVANVDLNPNDAIGTKINQVGNMFVSIHRHIKKVANNKYLNLDLWKDIITHLSNNTLWAAYPTIASNCVNALVHLIDQAEQQSLDKDELQFILRALNVAAMGASGINDDPAAGIFDRDIRQVTQQEFIQLMSEGRLKFINIVLVRDRMVWRTGTFIACKAACMTTYFGDANFMLGADVNHKMLLGHASAYTAAVVEKPEDIVHVPNAICEGYVCGGSTFFFDPNNRNHVTAGVNGNGLDRLESMRAIPLLPGESMIGTTVFDLTGAPPADLLPNARALGETPSMMPTYAAYWGWQHTLNYGPNDYNLEGVNNCIVRQGWSVMTRGDRKFEYLDKSSWIGVRCYPGMRNHLVHSHVEKVELDSVISSASPARAFDDDIVINRA